MNSVPPSFISCALWVFWKKAQQNKNLDSVLFAFFRKQHEFKRSHFDIECPLLANGSYKIKIRVLWIVFRHLISCALCVFWKKAQQNKNLDSVLFAFFRKQHEFKRSHFDIECPLLANGSNKIKIRVLWIVFRHLISCALCVFWKKAQQNKNLDSVLFAFFRKQHEFKRSHFDIECPLLANGSYKIKIRVLWIVFRHLLSVVRCECFEKKHSKIKISILCCLRFLENSTSLKEAILI